MGNSQCFIIPSLKQIGSFRFQNDETIQFGNRFCNAYYERKSPAHERKTHVFKW